MGLYLQLTYRCNLRCGHCYLKPKLNNGNEAFKYEDDVLRFLSHYRGIKRITIHGGEPVLFGLDRVKHISQKISSLDNVKIHFQTNLLSIKEEEIEDWVDYWKLFTNSRIGTSMDVYRNQYYRTWKEHVKIVKESSINITVLVTVEPHSEDFYKELIDFCLDNAIRIKFQYRYRESYEPEYIESIRKLVTELFDYITGTMKFNSNDLYKMFSLRKMVCTDTFTVSPDGSLYMCPTLSYTDMSKVGHIAEMPDIKNAPIYKYLINYYKLASDRCSPDCWQVCYGGCPANALGRYLSGVKELDPYCSVKQSLIRRIKECQ